MLLAEYLITGWFLSVLKVIVNKRDQSYIDTPPTCTKRVTFIKYVSV